MPAITTPGAAKSSAGTPLLSPSRPAHRVATVAAKPYMRTDPPHRLSTSGFARPALPSGGGPAEVPTPKVGQLFPRY